MEFLIGMTWGIGIGLALYSQFFDKPEVHNHYAVDKASFNFMPGSSTTLMKPEEE